MNKNWILFGFTIIVVSLLSGSVIAISGWILYDNASVDTFDENWETVSTASHHANFYWTNSSPQYYVSTDSPESGTDYTWSSLRSKSIHISLYGIKATLKNQKTESYYARHELCIGEGVNEYKVRDGYCLDFGLNAGAVRIDKFISGVMTTISSEVWMPFSASSDYAAVLYLQNGRVIAEINDVVLLNVSDTSYVPNSNTRLHVGNYEKDETYGTRTYVRDVYYLDNRTSTPEISAIVCSSSNDTTAPYTTSDTTPTFAFETDVRANCRIGNMNLNFSSMGSSRDCQTTGQEYHVCSLTVDDELLTPDPILYVTCQNYYSVNETNISLQMNITDLDANSTRALQRGIEASSIYPDMTVYDNQQVYLRDVNNNQLLTTVDKLVVYGNQRWLFNYIAQNETPVGLFNITPVVYVLELQNMTLTNIKNKVKDYIDATRN